MTVLGLENVDGTFGMQKKCDTCAMLSMKALATLGSDCIVILGKNYCRNCLLFGRPCCSWTKNGANRGMKTFSQGMIAGEAKSEDKVTSADVASNKRYRAGLYCQPLPKTNQQAQTFTQ
jgi:hypothetical protein